MNNFTDMVILGKMIDNAIKSGNISIGESFRSSKKSMTKGKKRREMLLTKNPATFTWNPHSKQSMYFLNMVYPSFNLYSLIP